MTKNNNKAVTKLIKTPCSMERLGYKIASLMSPGMLITLQGPLGSGKSVFVRGVARFFGISDHILSPTFTLLQEYQTQNRDTNVDCIYHFDLYRLGSLEEFDLIGGSEIVYDSSSISLIEWPGIISEYIIPQSTIRVDINVLENPLHREVSIYLPQSLKASLK